MAIHAQMTARLRKTADIIDEVGWNQGHEWNYKTGAVDLIGGLRRADGPRGDFHIVRRILLGRGYSEAWNDQIERTAQDVTSYLRTAEITTEDLESLCGPRWADVREVVLRTADVTSEQISKIMEECRDRPQLLWLQAMADSRLQKIRAQHFVRWEICGLLAHNALDQAPWEILDESIRYRGDTPAEDWLAAKTSVADTASVICVSDELPADLLKRLLQPWKTVFGTHPGRTV
jgi:hypothetical protein